jgi:alpha-tubulin suppressor-like RCC1 family protein
VIITDENGAFTLSYSLFGILAGGGSYAGQAGTYNVDVIHTSGAVLARATFSDSQGNHSCAITTGSGVKCWGANGYGQLGDGTFANSSTPVNVIGLSGVVQITVGVAHSCALTTAGGVKCWGAAGQGRLGDGSGFNRPTPGNVTGLANGVTQISGDGNHTCAVTTGGGVKCWGDNASGQLGDGTTTNRTTPVDVTGLTSGVVQVSASLYHSCAVTTGGSATCWGDNASGELGTGNTASSTVPVSVSGMTAGAALIKAGGNHTCAITTAGSAKCWGHNDKGQLGDGTFLNRFAPVSVTGLGAGVVQLGAGYVHNCVLTTSDGVKCWGDNVAGQLGDNSIVTRLAPVSVTGLTGTVAQVRAGGFHTCALTTGGGVECWGFNIAGQLGDGTLVNRLTPVNVSGLSSGVSQLWDGGPLNVDSNPPIANPTQSPAANSAGWNNSDVIVTWNWADDTGGSGINTASCTSSTTSTGEGLALTLIATCRDLANNVGTATYALKVDSSLPTISVATTASPNTAGWYMNNVTVHFTRLDGLSGVPPNGCPAEEILSAEGDAVTSTRNTAIDLAGNISEVSNSVTVKIDKTAPTITAAAGAEPNGAGWYKSDVTVHFTCTDAGSAIPAGACPADQVLTGEGVAVTSLAKPVTDAAGNISSSSNVVTVKIDRTAPSLSPSVSPNVVLLNGATSVVSGAGDSLSGLASQACGVADTTGVGTKLVDCTATDIAGNTNTVSAGYRVIYPWTGFLQPVDNVPILNGVKAGSAIPVKFGLGGNQGMNILASGYPLSRSIGCDSGAPLDDIEQTVLAGSSSLSFDPVSGQYSYVWKTEKAWALTCRQLVVTLADGTEHVANFKMK